MMFPLVRDLADDGIPATVTCRVLRFSTQGFYTWKKSPVTQRDWENAHLINAAYDIHADDPVIGYQVIADELPGQGIIAGENRVTRLCSQQRTWSVFTKKRGLNKKSNPPVHDDLLARRFTAQKPNQLWLTDITEHRTDTGKTLVREQGRVFERDRRLFDRFANESVTGCRGTDQCHRSPRAGRDDRTFRQR